MSIDLWTASEQFQELGQKLQATKSLTGRIVMERFLSWYRDSRIEGAVLENDGDMVSCSSGAMDFYSENPGDEPQRLRYLSFTRQIMPDADDPDAEFDDSHVEMCFSLGFESADGSEKTSQLWISTPDEIASGTRDFLSPAVLKLIDQEPQRFVMLDSSLL